MYYHFLKQKAAQGPKGQMGGFTRVLHDDSDGLEDEIPTCRVDRLKDELGFVVLSRPFAFKQFFEKCPAIEEEFILMAEPDHMYIKPVPNLMRGDTPAAFPFFYIKPIDRPDIVKRFLPGITDEEIGEIDTIGSSPVFIRKDDLERLAPEWAEMSVALQKDPEAKKAWGWVIEMLGYALASYKLGLRHDYRPQMQGATSVGQERRENSSPSTSPTAWTTSSTARPRRERPASGASTSARTRTRTHRRFLHHRTAWITTSSARSSTASTRRDYAFPIGENGIIRPSSASSIDVDYGNNAKSTSSPSRSRLDHARILSRNTTARRGSRSLSGLIFLSHPQFSSRADAFAVARSQTNPLSSAHRSMALARASLAPTRARARDVRPREIFFPASRTKTPPATRANASSSESPLDTLLGATIVAPGGDAGVRSSVQKYYGETLRDV